jgi:hypothetical protein
VHNFNKLIGKDIIIAHNLLKNDIPQHEYWLVTKACWPIIRPAALAGFAEVDGWDTSVKKRKSVKYFSIIHNWAPSRRNYHDHQELTDKIKVLSFTRTKPIL